MRTLVVAGCGLLGTSVAAAYRRAFDDAFIVGIEPDDKSRKTARTLGLFSVVVESVDAAQTGVASALKLAKKGLGSDVVDGGFEAGIDVGVDSEVIGVAATPPALIARALQALAPFCTLVVDVGSIKGPIIEELQEVSSVASVAVDPVAANIVPCHPMAGSHKRGPKAGTATLFDGRWVFVVPIESSGPGQIEAAHEFWRDLGAQTQQIEPRVHDEAVAHTSHLPHLLASAYMEVQDPEPAAAGTGFMDFTRLAKANPQMWSQILVANQEAWRPLLNRYIEVLQQAEKLVESGDTEAVESWLEARLTERLLAERPETL